MPEWDWQFFVVTLVAAGALWVLVRRFAPARRGTPVKGDAANVSAPPPAVACAHCASNPQTQTPQQAARAASRTATVPVVSLRDLRDTARH